MVLLKSRGLIISDEAKAVRYLESIGYYRLSAYMYPFLKIPKETHQYKDGTTFQQVLNLYRFDKKLRMLLLNEIEKVEIAIRRAIMNIPVQMTGDIYWLTKSIHFANQRTFQETKNTIDKEYAKSTEEFILKSATKPLNVLIAFTRPLITEFADNLNLKHPLLPTISPYPTM